MSNKPIKRNENILPLSRDHHSGLLFCWKIREGLNLDIPLQRIRPYVAYYWNEHLQEHFREEETLLFSAVNDPLCDDAIQQHVVIRGQFQKILENDEAKAIDYNLLQTLVNDHIRFEERELFPFLETAMTEAQLAEAGAELHSQHHIPFKDEYADEFWIRR